MHVLAAAIRLTAQLNLLDAAPLSAEVAARAATGNDPAHHVLDPDGVLGLDPLHSTDLDIAFAAARLLAPGRWVLAVPRPGAPGVLRGPQQLNAAAIDAGAAVVGARGLCAFVPHPVGNAIQWRLYPANTPSPPPDRYSAERALSEAVLTAGRALDQIGGAGGQRPDAPAGLLPPTYPAAARRGADRAAGLLIAAEAGMAGAAEAWSSHAVEVRTRELRTLRDCAADALSSAVSALDQ